MPRTALNLQTRSAYGFHSVISYMVSVTVTTCSIWFPSKSQEAVSCLATQTWCPRLPDTKQRYKSKLTLAYLSRLSGGQTRGTRPSVHFREQCQSWGGWGVLSLALGAGWQHPLTMPPTLLFQLFSPASKLSLPVTSSSPRGSCSCHSRV